MSNNFKGFQDEYFFLSNFYPCKVEYEDMIYPSSEHAFAAAKTLDIRGRILIQECSTPGLAKRMGRNVTLRKDWDNIRVDIMKQILHNKFMDNKELRERLLLTGNLELIEYNYWGDTFWGVCNGVGQNNLGKLLMALRQEILELGWTITLDWNI